MSDCKVAVEFKGQWDKKVFNERLKEIQENNPDKDFRFHSYGTFQSWKAVDTNFLDVATELLDPAEEDNHVMCYHESIKMLQVEWHTFCITNNLSKFAKLADRWAAREVSKVNNWLVKNNFESLDSRLEQQ